MIMVSGLLGRTFSPQRPGGTSRLAALGFFILALLGAGVALVQPETAQWAGAALLTAIGAAAFLVLVAAWPGTGVRTDEVRRAAGSAATRLSWRGSGRRTL